jgi:UDP-N-acetylmuramyl pentapeptide phosphotransferase/UDP-N-acetylglucosamine-1-phosphate transferase
LIKISIQKKIFDNPISERKLHKRPIPNIAGVSFFFTTVLCTLFLSNIFNSPENLAQLLAANIVLFLLGLKDDLVGLSSSIRFFGQLFSGLILIVLGDFRVQNLSIIGYSEVSYNVSVFISLLFFVMITNAYNLIDGINGLLGSLTIFSCICFSLFFYSGSDLYFFALMVSIIATTLSFLIYNFGNAKIFMGSSGSYVIGSIMYINSIVYLGQSISSNLNISKFSILFCILAIPLFDTLRVFFLRILHRKSPFTADSNHVHHMLLKLLPSHSLVVILIIAFNILLIGVSSLLFAYGDLFVLLFDFLILILVNIYIGFKITER